MECKECPAHGNICVRPMIKGCVVFLQKLAAYVDLRGKGNVVPCGVCAGCGGRTDIFRYCPNCGRKL